MGFELHFPIADVSISFPLLMFLGFAVGVLSGLFGVGGGPMTSLFVTLAGYSTFTWLQSKANGHSLLNPVVWAIIICVAFISLSGIDYETYMAGAAPIHLMLGPVTVALAVPIYRLWTTIKKDMAGILAAVFVCCFFAALSAMALAIWMEAERDIQLAILSKSVTAPIAIEMAKILETPEALAIFFVFTTGIPGSLLATYIFKIGCVKGDKAQGLALGTTCHGLGVARAFQMSESAGTYAIIGMSLMGIFSGLFIPALILLFF